LTSLVQQGPTRVTELAAMYDMSLNSVSKHIKVLERANLVTRRTLGRIHLIEANLTPVNEVDDWFKDLRSIWEIRLEALDNIVTKEIQMTDLSLTVSRTINASSKAVFDAWLNPEMLKQFMVPGDSMIVPSASTDPTVGGRFEIVMRNGDQDLPHSGTYTEINPHSRIAFTWETPFSETASNVAINFTPNGDGTTIELSHVKFESEESRDNHAAGWGKILDSLATVLG